MYELADNIIGPLQMAEHMKLDDVLSVSTTISALTGKSVGATTPTAVPAAIAPVVETPVAAAPEAAVAVEATGEQRHSITPAETQ